MPVPDADGSAEFAPRELMAARVRFRPNTIPLMALVPAYHTNVGLRLYFWRTQLGQEVDFFLTRGEAIVALEVETSTRVEQADLVGIGICEQAVGKRLRFSVVLYRGDQIIGLAPRRLAVPFEKAFLGAPVRK